MMTRFRLLAVIAAMLTVLVLLAGCAASGSSPESLPQDQNNEPQAAASAAPAAPAGDLATSGNTSDGSTLPVIDPGNIAASGKKVVYSAEMAIEAKDAAAAINDITSTVSNLGGYVADSQFSADNRNAQSWITVRIAPEKLNDFTKHVGTLGKVLNQSLTSQDVTDQYYDTQSRLTNAEAQETQLLEIMKQAVKIDDILKVRSELDTVQQEIEQMKGQLRLMDNQVGYSTLKITIQQPQPPAVVVEQKPDQGVQFWGFAAIGQKIGRGFSDSFNWTLNAISSILMALSYILIPVGIIAVFVFAVIIIVKIAVRGKKKKKE